MTDGLRPSRILVRATSYSSAMSGSTETPLVICCTRHRQSTCRVSVMRSPWSLARWRVVGLLKEAVAMAKEGAKEKVKHLQEGYVKKGGVNPPPTASRPAPPKGEKAKE